MTPSATHMRGNKSPSSVMSMSTMMMMMEEDHSSSSRHEDMIKEELDVMRSDSNMITQPIPSGTSCRHYVRRLLQTGLAHLKSQWKILFAGQVLSFLTAATGAAQATLSFDCHLSAPTLTLGICYAFLSLTLFYLVYQERREKMAAGKAMPSLDNMSDELAGTLTTPSTAPFRFLGFIPLQAHPLSYLPMALLDVYAKYFTVLAFKYTTITSVTLFDALAIPSAMILSHLFLHRHYSPIHLVRM